MAVFAARLLNWYRRTGRDLPWRRTRDPYALFISELMLQQTQVDRVLDFWPRWLQTFPTWKSLAEATTPELVHAWAGLGYNRRALFAREAAQHVVRDGIPTHETGWRKLKGVGPYMAAALAAFIDHQRAIVIDTNIRRVAGRALLGIPFPQLSDTERIRIVLDAETPHHGAHFDLPQAEMDLANTHCLVNTPRCYTCPLRTLCKARHALQTGTAIKPKRRVTERIFCEKRWPDRIYRGRILQWIREHGPTPLAHLGSKIDETYKPEEQDWVQSLVERLHKDGFLDISLKWLISLRSD